MGSIRKRETVIDDKTQREALKIKRNLLYKRYVKNPQDPQRALEIKILDDQVAEFTRQIDRKGTT